MKLTIMNKQVSPRLDAKLRKAMALLPEMKTTDTTLDDPANYDAAGNRRWSAEEKDGDLSCLKGAFFTTQMTYVSVKAEGQRVSGWVQPLTRTRTEDVEDQDGNTIKVSALVIGLYDDYHRVLMRMVNEPGARPVFIGDKEIHPKLAMAMQTSVAKMNAVMAGDVAKDQSLAKLLPVLEKSKMTFENLTWRALDSGHDTNRQDGIVLYAQLVVSPNNLSKIAKQIGGMIFLLDEAKEIVRATNLLNPHGLICF